MKISFLIGLIIGGGTVFLFLRSNRSTPATMTVTSSDPRATISHEQLAVQTKRTQVEAIASFQTDRAGFYTNTITINRNALQYKHSLALEGSYFINTQMPVLSLSYSYSWFLISIKAGYSFKLHTTDYGLGIGGVFRW
ncbi:MAG: hypothetical protein ACRC0X_02215 [Brevinema sp.]